jgi:TolB-like protein
MRPTQTGGLPGGNQEDDRPGVAVWPFANGGSFGSDPWDYASLEVGLQQMLITELSQNSELRLVERGRIKEIIEELELGQTGYVAPETTAQVGQVVGAKYMVVGGFVDANGTLRLDARVDNVETSEILTETAVKVEGDRENLLDMVVDLSVKVVESVDLPPLPGRVVEERKSIELSAETARTYFLALRRDDAGDLDEARQLYRRVVSEAPQYSPARMRLEQLGGDGP